MIVRNAWPTDDLTVLWPNLGRMKLNLQHVIIACDEDDTTILGGILILDSGHDIAFVGEFTLIGPEDGRPLVAAKLMANVALWAQTFGKTRLMFHTLSTGPFASFMLKHGAQVAMAPVTLMTMEIGS